MLYPMMPGRIGAARKFPQRVLTVWEHPLWAGLFALVIYALFTIRFRGLYWPATRSAYFNYLADALLHGQLHLRAQPPSALDLSVFEGRFYLYWPPFPALLLLPFVAVWGVQFSDPLFTIGIAALNVSLVAILLRRLSQEGIAALSSVERALLVVFFALGTVHSTLAPYASVWFTGQLVGFGCVALAYLATLSLRGMPAFVCAGLALACAFLTRNHLILTGLWPAYYLLLQHRALPWKRLAICIVAGIMPVVAGILLFGLYNQLRFGSVFDNGLAYHHMSSLFLHDYQRYGAFHIHYVPTNFFYQYIAYPLPLRSSSPLGGSLFLLSPVFFAIFWALHRGRPRPSIAVLVITILLTATPILLLMGTGYKQFGPRYTLDFTVPLLLLTAIGIRFWSTKLVAVLTAISVVQYVIGTLLLYTILSKM
jgi:hypothetical protein